MATGLDVIHNAIAARLRTLTRASGFTVSPWPDSNVPAPRMFLQPREQYVMYYGDDANDGGLADVGGPARVLVEIVIEYPSDAGTAFEVMTDLLTWKGSSSIHAALNNNRTLGGVVDSCVTFAAEWDEVDPGEPHRARVPLEISVTKE